MSAYRSALEAALEAMRKAAKWIYYRRLAGGDPMSEEEELLFRAVAKSEEELRRTEQAPVATLHDDGCFTWKRDEFRLKYDRQRAGWRMDVYACPPEPEKPAGSEVAMNTYRSALEAALKAMRAAYPYTTVGAGLECERLRASIASTEEVLRSPSSWHQPSPYEDAYAWHTYSDKPEEKERQPVNGPGTAVDSRSAARISSSAFHSQPSGIVSSGVSPPSRATHIDTIIGLCDKCLGQVADACDVIGYRRPAPTCLKCGAMALQPTQIRKSMFGTLVMMGDPPVDEVWTEDFWRKGKP
jgi:hypothetical protein